MAQLPKFRRGMPLSELRAADLNAMVDAIRARTILPSNGVLVRQTSNGVTLSVGSSVSGIATGTDAWDLLVSAGATPNTYSLKVQPGTLDNVLPSNWSASFSCDNTSLYYAKAAITTDGKSITSVAIEINTTAPTTQEPQAFAVATSVTYLFGLFQAGTAYRVIAPGNITLSPQLWLTKEKASPAAAGALPYDLFYRLQ